MKNISKFLVAAALVVGYNGAHAQDKNNPWQISIGVNAVDFYPTGEAAPIAEPTNPFGGVFEDFLNTGDHWNILPSLSTVSLSRYIKYGVSFGVSGSLNKIDKWGSKSVDDLMYYSIDGTLKYSFGTLLKSKVIDPYVGLGGGYVHIHKNGTGTGNGTLGLNLWFNNNIGFTLQSTYKHSFEHYRYLRSHFQHTAGISIKFGGTDTDGDGVFDKYDACPEVPGLASLNGCPDTDGDGIQDSKDDCPNVAGLIAFNGCPDTDGDGIADKNDKCPNVAGSKALSGCPDGDGDGVADGYDRCPNIAGPKANQGCPWPDTDNDGVLDKNDRCPKTAGTVANNGCPEVSPAVQAQLNAYAKTISFDVGKYNIKTQFKTVLNDIVTILNEYPYSKFTLEGHADSTGGDKINQKLSYDRAEAVKSYLVSNGVNDSRLSAMGYSKTRPIASNKTRKGRAKNRRVEIHLVK